MFHAVIIWLLFGKGRWWRYIGYGRESSAVKVERKVSSTSLSNISSPIKRLLPHSDLSLSQKAIPPLLLPWSLPRPLWKLSGRTLQYPLDLPWHPDLASAFPSYFRFCPFVALRFLLWRVPERVNTTPGTINCRIFPISHFPGSRNIAGKPTMGIFFLRGGDRKGEFSMGQSYRALLYVECSISPKDLLRNIIWVLHLTLLGLD